VVDIIHRRSALARGLVADRSPDQAVAERGLRRMGVLLQELGNPQFAYRVIHVAGSKGKGTTTHIAADLLTALGYRVGRYVSPHLLSWNERIAIDGLAISDSDFAAVLAFVDGTMSALESRQPDLGTFNAFELLTAAAYLYFRDRRCDAAVIEVGLGGRFDSTNHVHSDVSVITRIEAEHVDILGPTLAQIAWNKAGIIKPGVPVVVCAQQPDVEIVIEAEATKAAVLMLRDGVEWTVTETDGGLQYRFGTHQPLSFTAALPGAHNRGNIGAALTAVQTLIGDRSLADKVITDVLSAIRIPGRFDRRIDDVTGRRLILDGAHTPESMRMLVATVRAVVGPGPAPVIMGLLADKPAEDILAVLAPAASQIVFPELSGPRIVPAESLCAIARRAGIAASVRPTIRAALDAIGTGPEPILITGSFGMVAASLTELTSAP